MAILQNQLVAVVLDPLDIRELLECLKRGLLALRQVLEACSKGCDGVGNQLETVSAVHPKLTGVQMGHTLVLTSQAVMFTLPTSSQSWW